MLSQATSGGTVHHLLYDGHGSTRALTDTAATPAVTASYDFDAYGNALGFDPTAAATSLLYAGEYLASAANQYYLRARHYDTANGRFNRLDPFAGNNEDPQSLHKYAYVHSDPVNRIDPSGHFFAYLQQLIVAGFQGFMRMSNQLAVGAANLFARAGIAIITFVLNARQGIVNFLNWASLQAQRAQGLIVRLPSNIWQRFTQYFQSWAPQAPSQAQAAQQGFLRHEQIRQAWQRIMNWSSDLRLHHLVEQGKGVQRFGQQAIQSFQNTVPIPRYLHQLISNMYSSGVNGGNQFMRLPQFAGNSTLRQYVSKLSWTQQWEWGYQVYLYVLKNGSTVGFDPTKFGLK